MCWNDRCRFITGNNKDNVRAPRKVETDSLLYSIGLSWVIPNVTLKRNVKAGSLKHTVKELGL